MLFFLGVQISTVFTDEAFASKSEELVHPIRDWECISDLFVDVFICVYVNNSSLFRQFVAIAHLPTSAQASYQPATSFMLILTVRTVGPPLRRLAEVKKNASKSLFFYFLLETI